MKKCVMCGHAVSRGDRHAKFSCPPRRGHTGVHFARRMKNRKDRRRLAAEAAALGIDQRGKSVAGIHKVAASSKENKKRAVITPSVS